MDHTLLRTHICISIRAIHLPAKFQEEQEGIEFIPHKTWDMVDITGDNYYQSLLYIRFTFLYGRPTGDLGNRDQYDHFKLADLPALPANIRNWFDYSFRT
jgi:hypothetical protein